MMVTLVNPTTHQRLRRDGEAYVDSAGGRFPILREIGRFCEASNYTENFGKQWNLFRDTQIDRPCEGMQQSEARFFAVTGWTPDMLAGLDVLEVGSGAGRFSQVVLKRTEANLWSVDYSSAVDANWQNNGSEAPERFHLFQASIYEMPFPSNSFDKVFCMGVLQHTPDFSQSVKALVDKAKPGGEIVVDFYPIRGIWTKIHAKYLLRPITKRMSHDTLLKIVRANAGWMISLSSFLNRVGLSPLTRFVPICDIKNTLPKSLTKEQLKDWVVLDTFDMFSPEYDNPQRVETVASMFEQAGADVTFAGFIQIDNVSAAVLRATKREVAA